VWEPLSSPFAVVPAALPLEEAPLLDDLPFEFVEVASDVRLDAVVL